MGGYIKKELSDIYLLLYSSFEYCLMVILMIFVLIFSATGVYGEPFKNKQKNTNQIQISEKTDTLILGSEKQEHIDVFSLTLEEMMNITVDVSSKFLEEDLVAGSSVSKISSEKWKIMGARRMHEVLNNEMSVMTYPHYNAYPIAIRGYTSDFSYKGVAFLMDGIPLNDLSNGTAVLFHIPNWEIGTLDSVELVKGPGSAIYGSDAFHGVFSMKSFESGKDTFVVEGAGGFPLYGDANMKISRGIADGRIRINAAGAVSRQGDLDMDFEFDDNGEIGTGKRKYEYGSGSGVLKVCAKPNERLDMKIGTYTNYWSGEDFPGAGSRLPVLDKDLASIEGLFHMGTSNVSYMFDNDISIEASGYYWEFDGQSELYVDQSEYMVTSVDENRYSGMFILKQADNALNLQWFLGYSYDNQDIELFCRDIRSLAGQVVADLGEQPQSGWSRYVNSIFGQLKWGVAKDKLYFLMGGRGDDYSNYDIQFTPRCGIIFLPVENSSVKALYGRAFMAPNAFNLFGSPGNIEGNPDLSPETIDVYELIYMYRAKDWRFSINSFYSLWKDGIISKYDQDASIYQQVNEGENRSYGGEMNLFYSMDPVAVELGLSYVKSMAVDSINAITLEEEDQSYGLFPEYSINLGLYYTLRRLDINFYVNNRIYLNMKESMSHLDPDPDSLPPYYRMDINMSRKFKDNLEMILDIRNVLNRKNYIPGLTVPLNGVEEPGTSILLRMGYTI